jgi:peptidoglycan/xylan/chitin deacetylase (PgdA/CDA1 family)
MPRLTRSHQKPRQRFHLLSWLIIPIIGIWVFTAYLMGSRQSPAWEIIPQTPQPQVLSAHAPTPPVSLYTWAGTGLVTFWLDDAWLSQFQTGFLLLDQQSYAAALSVPTGVIGQPNYMSWAHVKYLQDAGWEITSHTRSHSCEPDRMTPEQLTNELLGSQQDLQTYGLRADHFVTPCGQNSDQVTQIAKKYYLSLRTTNGGLNPLPVPDPYDLMGYSLTPDTTLTQIEDWLQSAKNEHLWLIIIIHQVDYSQDQYSTSPVFLNQVIHTVKTSGLPVVLPSQALQLVNLTPTPGSN